MRIWINTLLNASGLVIPAIVSLPAMGYLSRSLGVEGFGLFLLIFSILGYASIFDFGLNRALVLNFAKNKNDIEKDSVALFTGSVFVICISLFFGGAIFIFSNETAVLLNVSEDIKKDAVHAIQLLFLAIPVTLFSLVLFSIFEGKQLFFEMNVLKVISGSFIGCFPAFFVFFESSVFYATLGITVARIIVIIGVLCRCAKFVDLKKLCWSFSELQRLLNFGAWITLSNILSLLMSGVDKFLLSNFVGAKNASFYVSASEMIARIAVIPGALAKTIFPYFASNEKNEKSYREIYFGLIIVLFFFVVPLFVFSEEIFNIWLGEEFSRASYHMFDILLIGFLFNALAQIPFSKIQAAGFSKVTTMIHFFEVVPYFVVFFVLMDAYGVVGVAYAWSFRVLLDYILLEFFSFKLCSK